jgi:hypothetical protein
VSGKHSYYRARWRVGDLVLGPWPLACKVARVNCLAQRSGRAKRQSQRLNVFQGMRAPITYGETKSDILKRSQNVAKTMTDITGDNVT